MKTLVVCLFFLLPVLLTSSFSAAAQRNGSSDFPLPQDSSAIQITLGQSAAPLYGPWKFRAGDSPTDPSTNRPMWAQPDFDDSGWETVDLTPAKGAIDPTSGWTGYVPGWTARGHRGYWGYAWYRIRVQEQEFPGKERETLALWDVDDAYQLFADGELIGGFDIFRGTKAPVTYWNEPRMFDLPEQHKTDNPSPVSVTHVIAFRVWCDPNTMNQNPDGGGLHVAPIMGDGAAVGAKYQTAWLELIKSYAASAAEALIFLILALGAGSLVFFDRSDRVYLWLACVFLLTAADSASFCLFAWTLVANQRIIYLTTDALFRPLILGGWVMTWWIWFRLHRPPWFPKVVGGLVVLYGVSNALGEDLFFTPAQPGVRAAFHLAAIGIRLSFLGLLVLLVFQGIREQGREGWLALPAVVLVGIAQFQIDLLVLHIPTVWYPLGVGVGLSDVASAALSIVIFALLLRRLQQSLKQQRQLALDVKQAQEVQQVILPEARTVLPGLVIESDYRPAREVGGDFFQIIPNDKEGSVLIVAGDVTGKGLRAGMLVALLVGAIRTVAENNSEPQAVLHALNRRLLGRGHAQATCLALRIAPDGRVTMANAGHLPPYLNGEPVAIEGALPLGMIDAAEFSIQNFRLTPGDKVVLVSDGVAEATDENGNLFGFDRLRELLRAAKTCAEIANAAQTFGQEDDITVLSLTCAQEPIHAA